MGENLNRFTKLNLDLTNCNEKLSKDQMTIVMLNSIIDRHKNINVILEYDREELIADIIIIALRNKAIMMKTECSNSQNGDNFLGKGKVFGKSNYHSKCFNEVQK